MKKILAVLAIVAISSMVAVNAAEPQSLSSFLNKQVSKVSEKEKEIKGLHVVYYHNGYFNNDEDIYKELLNNSPRLILVAMGSPRQEEFIYNAKKLLKPALMIGIGGSLDVWSGMVKRAPKIYQTLGLEWLYRTVTQPSRIKRIFPTLPLFIIKAFKYKFFK